MTIKWEICRVCLQVSENMISIFSKDNQCLITEKISSCSNIQINNNQLDYPETICSQCSEYLDIAFKFRRKCENSDKIIKKLIREKIPQNCTILEIKSNGQVILKTDPDEDYFEDKNEQESQANSSSSNAYEIEKLEEEFDDGFLSSNEYEEIKEMTIDILEQPVAFSTSNDENEETPSNNFVNEIAYDENDILIKEEKKSFQKKNSTNKLEKPIKEYVCTECGNKYKKKQQLTNHTLWHKSEKNYKCEICGSSYGTNFELNRHLRVHTGQKPYTCDICQRKFSDYTSCKKHKRTHTNERNYKCSICSKGFNYAHVLKAHMKVHEKDKAYVCLQCDKTFLLRHHLTSHLATIRHRRNSTK